MARTVRGSTIAFPAEIARYLAVDPAAVDDMIETDKLPVLRVLGKTRRVKRVPLRDFHAWLMERAENPVPQLRRWETFLKDFDATARVGKVPSAE